MLAAGAAPGALLGALLAGLLFFLNPQLPFAVAPVARAVVIYGALLGAASFVLLLPFCWRRRRRARRMLPWSLTVVLAAVAIYDWSHASYYAYYLPPGINTRLTKAGLLLAIGALVSFYTALLHTLHRRPYGPRSRLLYVALTAAAVYAQIERREAFRPPPCRPRVRLASRPGGGRAWWSWVSRRRPSTRCCRSRNRSVCLFSRLSFATAPTAAWRP